ncbi:hypothetical protein BLA29_011333 [Euroglyphus maynei]|uniref:Uncharacterized protein n=1 Tax=Euroglyphus maynei TaxID=6958 RepID=A0A1Y3BJL6_EURMA|nr:hypothetical protein BLA29_011333 [Euroglyphus maynei]
MQIDFVHRLLVANWSFDSLSMIAILFLNSLCLGGGGGFTFGGFGEGLADKTDGREFDRCKFVVDEDVAGFCVGSGGGGGA